MIGLFSTFVSSQIILTRRRQDEEEQQRVYKQRMFNTFRIFELDKT